jgi:diacylglycerol kinase family enzyme
MALIRDAGHEVVYKSSTESWDKVLDQSWDLAAVAGGDGTVGEVAASLMGRRVPLAVLPLGTANNISNTLGLTEMPLAKLIAAWSTGTRLKFDVGVATGPWGSTSFMESIGVGLFSRTMAKLDARNNIALAHVEDARGRAACVVQMLHERLQDSSTVTLKAMLDGHDISGEYILLEAMNTRQVGPKLNLAPDANPSDGLFDVVRVLKGEQPKLEAYLSSYLDGQSDAPPWRVERGQHLQIDSGGFDVHIDDTSWPGTQGPSSGAPGPIDVTIDHHALEFLVPRREGAR